MTDARNWRHDMTKEEFVRDLASKLLVAHVERHGLLITSDQTNDEAVVVSIKMALYLHKECDDLGSYEMVV